MLAIVVAVAPAAVAHLRYPKLQAERWIELRLDDDPIRVGYRVGFGAKLAGELREEADANGDGEVSAAEANAAFDARTKVLLKKVRICLGDTLEAMDCRELTEEDIESREAQGWVPGPKGHLHFAWKLLPRARAADIGAIRLEDSYDVPGVDISDVSIEAPKHAPLVSAGSDERDGVSSKFTWLEARRAPGPRIVHATWQPPRRRGWIPWAAASLLVLGGAIGGWWLGARKRGS